jgi:hypothetical protein
LRIALQTAQQGFEIAIFEKGQSVFIVGGAKLDFVKSLRADLVIDYTKQSYDQVFEKLFSDNSEDVQ